MRQDLTPANMQELQRAMQDPRQQGALQQQVLGDELKRIKGMQTQQLRQAAQQMPQQLEMSLSPAKTGEPWPSPEATIIRLMLQMQKRHGQVDSNFNTRIPPGMQTDYAAWKARNAPQDSGMDYDLQGAYRAGLERDKATNHFDDRFKKPNHPTFSDQSQYAGYGNPGSWEGDTYIPPR